MNAGERDELVLILKLIDCRDSGQTVPQFGTPQKVGFYSGATYFEYPSIPTGISFQSIALMDNTSLADLTKNMGISKAASNYKADVVINGYGVSLKSTRKAPPAIVNHTNRKGIEFAAAKSGGNMAELDKLVAEYWQLRDEGKINQDVKNSDPNSPFSKKLIVLKPFLNYFIFDGTGSRLSKAKADYVLSFKNAASISTWSVSNRSNTVGLYWNNMVFSMRGKGLPKNYPNVSSRSKAALPSIKQWTRKVDDKFKGTLHVRTS